MTLNEKCEDAISRELLKAHIAMNEKTGDFLVPQLRTILELIDELPSVRPARPRGQWIHLTGHDPRDDFYECSECHRSVNMIGWGNKRVSEAYPYCHCGADMQESEG